MAFLKSASTQENKVLSLDTITIALGKRELFFLATFGAALFFYIWLPVFVALGITLVSIEQMG